MVNLEDFVNLSNPTPQYFSFAKPLINYIFVNSTPIVSSKFLKSCKTFKLFHLQTGKCQFKELHLNSSSYKFDLGTIIIGRQLFKSLKHYKYRLRIEMKSVKVSETLSMNYLNSSVFNYVLPKLDLSETRKIEIFVNFLINDSIIDKIIHPKIENLGIMSHFNEKCNPTLMAFQRCPNMTNIWTGFYPVSCNKLLITKNNFKEIVQSKRNTKIVKCDFLQDCEIYEEDMIAFIENHLEVNSTVHLTFNDFTKLKQMEQILNTIASKRAQSKVRFNLSRLSTDLGYPSSVCYYNKKI